MLVWDSENRQNKNSDSPIETVWKAWLGEKNKLIKQELYHAVA